MFFSLTNSPATFQMMMNMIFRQEVAQGWLSIYMDDIAIHTKPLPDESESQHRQQHMMLTHQILQKLHNNDLYLKPAKCKFAKNEIEYLGVIIGRNQMRMDPHKLDSVHQWKSPQNPTEVCQFLGFTGYYRYFIPNYSKIARPLLDLTKKTELWQWGPTQKAAFLKLKTHMCSSPVLTQSDFKKHFYLQANASAYSVGAILSQEGKPLPTLAKCTKPVTNPITYYLATFTPTERNYDIYKQELLAIMKSLAHWRPYLG
jgi:hypothetical protein